MGIFLLWVAHPVLPLHCFAAAARVSTFPHFLGLDADLQISAGKRQVFPSPKYRICTLVIQRKTRFLH
ncbi:TPA: hypothetical protein DDW35_01330 [Candidatus Sumerlaeota bacterium]|nr:hypothetical protein [Candidatus Sumerlaeota bacterium]